MEQSKDSKKEKLSFRQFISVVKWLINFNFKLSSSDAILYAMTSIFIGMRQLFGAYFFAKILDGIIKIINNSGAKPADIIPLLLLYLLYNLIFFGINSINVYIDNKMRYLSDFKSTELLASHINSLGIQTLESPEVVNKIQRTRETIRLAFSDFDRVTALITRLVVFIAASLVILKTIPIFVLLIFVSMLPQLISNRIHIRKTWQYFRETTEERRAANMINGTLTESSNLQEITIISAFKYLNGKYKNSVDKFMKENTAILKKWFSFRFLLGSLVEITSIFGYFSILKNLFSKFITIGDATFQIRSLDIFIDNMSSSFGNFISLFERCLRIKEVKDFFEMKSIVADGKIKLPKLETAPEIKFKNISFKYPDSDNFVIKNLNLEIKSGDKIAIVGENGAGKTTLIKLLCRFYKVNEGNIFLDENNINDIKIDSWYKNIGVLFQEYNTYSYLTVRENIYLGESDDKINNEKIKLVAKKAHIDSFVNNYKNKYEQILSEKFKGGTRPSTGQWQKIAIARFFYRNSPVVIFDEPTASIDAISESKIFSQIYNFFKDKTVIIISHRFSTVRNADKIYVLDKGEIIESGNHEELIKKQGRYAMAFNIQAEGYK